MYRIPRFFIKRHLFAAFLALAASGARADSGDVVFGETFDTEDDFARWTLVDNNGGRTWEFLNGAAAYMLDYQTGLPGDDWCISPEFHLSAGRVYELKFYLGINSMPENLKVFLGTSSEPSTFTKELADYNNVTSSDSGTKTLKIYVNADGNYRLGFYAYSQPNMHRIDIDNVSVTDIASAGVPGAVAGLTVVPAELGGMSADLSFVAPDVTATDETLTANVDINIYRNGGEEPVKTYKDVKPGAPLTWKDTEPAHGFNTYRVVAANAEGEGAASEQKVFVGLDTPVAATNAVAKLNADKSVTVTWTAPAASVNGGYVDFDNMTYNISRGDEVIATSHKGESYTDKVPVERGQALVAYTITPVAGGQSGEPVVSSSVLSGVPLVFPYKESFAGQKPVVPWYVDGTVADFEWHTIGDDEIGEFEEVMTQDSDNGMIVAESKYADYGARSRYVSPLIDLSGAVNPELRFWFYKARSPWYDPEWDGEVNDRLQVQISFDGGEWQDIDNAVFYQNENSDGWVECVVNLPKQEASFVNIGLLATAEADAGAYRNMYVDNISIDESEYVNDLAITSFTVDNKRAGIGDEVTYTASVFNRGGNTAAGYKVDFVCDGEVVATADGADVEPANTVNVTYKVKAAPADAVAGSHEWQAVVKYDADEFDGNNASETLSTSVRRSDLPVVNGLSATGTPGNASLTWNAAASIPAVEHGEMQTVTDDFEDYEPFIIDNIGLWNVYDADKSTTMVSPRIPNSYEHQGEPMAFQVFNIEQAGVWVDGNMDDAFMPVNDASSQMLVCPSVDWPAENDDWLITPRLDGRQQTISFYAKAATYDSEWINVYYSTTDNHHDSFVKLNEDDHIAVSDGWRKYTYIVPEGARYFAVRCVRRVVMLMIDDFTYAPYDGSQEAAELLGYNVYRDNVKINTELVTTNKFTDTEAGHSEAVYTVTAVYDSGESAYSNEAVLTTTGISRPDADATATESARYAIDGRRLDAPERGVNIVRMTDGKVRKVIVR